MFEKYKQAPVEKSCQDLLGWIKFKIQTAIEEAMIQAYTTELIIEQYQMNALMPE